MARTKKIKQSLDEILLEVRAENKRKLDEILSIPDYQEVLGRKWYGSDWRKTLWGNHPARVDAQRANYERTKKRLSGEEHQKAFKWSDKSVIQMDLDGNVIKVWDTAMEAGEEIKGNRQACQQIVLACRGRAQSAYKSKWKFVEDNEGMDTKE